MIKFKVFSRLNGFFSRLNPLNSFDVSDVKVDIVKPPTFKELLEKTVNKYPKFEKIILIGIYHLINTQNADKEYLTVLTKDMRLVADLMKGNLDKVNVPDIVKIESKKNNILLTCHNHIRGSIIPSKNDFYNMINPNILFTIIVSKEDIGIIINDSINRKISNKKLICTDWDDYRKYLEWCFLDEYNDEIKHLKMFCKSKKEFKKKYDILFLQFVEENSEKFVDEFNMRMKKYNIYILHINI